ncbi:ankyrin repeat-containing domain protein [Achaetomium macrosporum]|uniref:Ankyrin repeat-containing domain protein n=1 Tax=Achaetomium macrosporum TaxID=79813 RepID=A0AAN7H7Q1_9PEZI|nr:ankyrin repeat-containing domain protein [Achaetomium macrosporum]
MTDQKNQGKQFSDVLLNLKGIHGSGTASRPSFMSLYVQLSTTSLIHSRLSLTVDTRAASRLWPTPPKTATPIMEAYNKFEDWMEEFSEDEAEERRETALACAFRSDDKEVVKTFMLFVLPDEINRCLHMVRAVENVKIILETGRADVDCFLSGKTKLYHAARSRDPDVVRLLLEHGADPNRRCNVDFMRSNELMKAIKPHDCERGPTPLHGFTGHGNSERVVIFKEDNDSAAECLRLLIAAGADVNATIDERCYGQSMTLLHYVVQKTDSVVGFNWGSMDKSEEILAKLLLSVGADPNAKSKDGNTPLHLANPEKPRLLEILVAHGADIDAVNARGRSLLLEMINQLAYNAALDKPKLNHYNQCSRGRSDNRDDDEGVLGILVDAGMDPNVRDKAGHTFLWMLMTRYGIGIKAIEKFVRLGAGVTALVDDGRTLLHAAVAQAKPAEWFSFLISVGAKADVLEKDGSMLIYVLLCGSHSTSNSIREVLQVLIDAGALPLARNAKGQSALHGLDINEPDTDGLTPLHHAVGLGEESVWTLVRAGADPTSITVPGLSPLHVAARSGKANVVGMLLEIYRERGILQKQVNRLGDGGTPLHYACRSGVPEAVWTLLYNGAGARVTDEKGLTPLHVLAEFELLETVGGAKTWSRAGIIVGMLKDGGADVNAESLAVTEDGTTSRVLIPLDVAVEKGRWEMTKRERPRKLAELKPAYQRSRSPRPPVVVETGDGEVVGRLAQAPSCHLKRVRASSLVDRISSIEIKAKSDHGKTNNNGDEKVNGAVILEFEEGHADLLEYFRDKVAELEAQEWVQKDKDSDGTLLGSACERQKPSLHIVQLLVDRLGVDVNAVYNRSGYCHKLRGTTALHILASGAHFWQVEALGYLLSKGADIEARNKDGMTPLLAAIDRQADASVTVKAPGTESDGRSALELSDQAGVTKSLLEHGASVESCPGILRRAIKEWMEPGIVELLLDAELDPNQLPPSQEKPNDGIRRDRSGQTEPHYTLHDAACALPRHFSAFDFKGRQQAVIELLVSKGADVCAPYPDGSFVLQAIVEDRGQVQTFLPGLSLRNCNRKGRHRRTLLASACLPVTPTNPDTPT